MRGLEAVLSACTGPRWGTIVWGGVGYGAAIAAVRELDARRCVYLEPNTELRARFAQKYVLSERERLSGNALWRATEVCPLHVVTDPLKSSLVPPDEVLKVWPNLRKLGQYDVQAQSLDALIVEHEVSSEDHNLLVLDLCGAECEVLAAADEALLLRFTHIVISDAQAATGECIQLLTERGYELHRPIGDTTGSWLFLRREQLAVEAVEGTRSELLDRSDRELGHSSQRAAQQEVELQQAVQRATQLETELQQAVQRATQLETELQQSKQRITQLEIGLQESAQHAIHLDSELQKSVQHAAQLDAELQQSAQRMAQLDADLQQTRQTTRMAVQMQAQREADLIDLQARYRDGQGALERQHALLDKLGERLGLASDYFHQLSASTDNSHPKLDSAGLPGSGADEKAETAPRGGGRVRKAAKSKSRP